jgi:hypothetical protein
MGSIWNSIAPHHVVSAYKRGQGFALAIALHRKYKLPLYGAKDKNGLVHHFFVVDSGRAVDIRGSIPFEMVALGSQADGGTLEPVTEAEIVSLVEDFRCFGAQLDKADIRKAYRTSNRYLRRIQTV